MTVITEDGPLVGKSAPFQSNEEALASQRITVKVEHPSYKRAIAVRVSEAATLFDVRNAVASVFSPNQLDNVRLWEKNNFHTGDRFCKLHDNDMLKSSEGLLAVGGPVLALDGDEHDVDSVPAKSTVEFIKEGRAVEHTGRRAIVDGEIIRVEAESLKSGASFFIDLLSEKGDVVMRWQADADDKRLACTSSLQSWDLPPVTEVVDVKDMDGAWTWSRHNKQRVIVDFELSALKWKIHVNGIRMPRLDFARRAPVDVTQVKTSESLTNARVILILRSENDLLPIQGRALLKKVRVTHAVYGRSIEVSVPANATMLDVRKTILEKTKTAESRLEEILLVEKVGRTFAQLPNTEALNGHTELLALGCNKAFSLDVDSSCSKLANSEPYSVETDDIRGCGQVVDLTKGHKVCLGDTIRVQADGWCGDVDDSIFCNNTFYINLVSDRGEVALHWGARKAQNRVVRNSWIDGSWGKNGAGFCPPEESIGAWPHGERNEPLVIDFTRTAFDWKIHINHVRQPAFDFAHRMPDDVTDVHVSNNLLNPKILLIPSAENSSLSLGCLYQNAAGTELQRRFDEFQVDRPVKDGETIRVEAQWCDKDWAQAAKTNNAFFIDLKSNKGDLALHWGARPHWRHVVRNSKLDGSWGREETKGGWPHWSNFNVHPLSDFFGESASDLGHHVLVDFTRTDRSWLVSVNGKRLPAFDYKHRTTADVTHVALSDSLCNVRVTLFAGAEEKGTPPVPLAKGEEIAMPPLPIPVAEETAMSPLPTLLRSSSRSASFGEVWDSGATRANLKNIMSDGKKHGERAAKADDITSQCSESKDNLQPTSAKLGLSKLRAGFDDNLKQIQSSLQERKEVDSLDFETVHDTVGQLDKSMRLLGRVSDFAQPSSALCKNQPQNLRASVMECMTRSNRSSNREVAERVPEDPTEVVEIVVKDETNAGQMKLTMVGKRREPVTIAKVKEAVVAELGSGNTSEIGFLLNGGDRNVFRLDSEVIRPSKNIHTHGTKRRFELVVQGIELPKPTEPQSSMNLS